MEWFCERASFLSFLFYFDWSFFSFSFLVLNPFYELNNITTLHMSSLLFLFSFEYREWYVYTCVKIGKMNCFAIICFKVCCLSHSLSLSFFLFNDNYCVYSSNELRIYDFSLWRMYACSVVMYAFLMILLKIKNKIKKKTKCL